MPKIYLYAELLQHIRQLTLYASLQTEKAEGTKVDVATNKKVIQVTHDGETQRLYLPTQISGTAQIVFPLEKKTEVSARLQIDDDHEWKNSLSSAIEAPWTALSLTPSTSIRCKQCHVYLVLSNKVGVWQDLPSDNWAEMLEYWICHKPPEDINQGNSGISGKQKLAVKPGVGMTDLHSIVLHQSDCVNIHIFRSSASVYSEVARCSACNALMGTATQGDSMIRLHKSSIEVSRKLLSVVEATSIKKIVVYSTSPYDSATSVHIPEPLILWIFNPDIFYSCSAYDQYQASSSSPVSTAEPAQAIHTEDNSPQLYPRKTFIPQVEFEMNVPVSSAAGGSMDTTILPQDDSFHTPPSQTNRQPTRPVDHTTESSQHSTEHTNLVHRAAKVFYGPLPQGITASSFLDLPQHQTMYEELQLMNPADLSELQSALISSTRMLPVSARRFQDWSVGLLERWEFQPTGLKVMQDNPLAHSIKVKDLPVRFQAQSGDDASQL